jgi:hypothetical protein
VSVRSREWSWARLLPRARLVVLGIVGAYFLALLALGGRAHWGRLGVGPGSVPFGDLRSVTSGWDCTRRGIDILAANPCDQSGRPANYPRIWMWLSFLGLGARSTVVLGVVIAIVFLIAAVAVLPAASRPREAVLYGLALCSPAVMLGVERGNVDILLFALVLLAVLLFRRSERSSVLTHGLLLLAAILKLFPIFAIGVLLRQPRRRVLIGLGAVVVLFGIYLFAIRADLRTLARVTPQPDTFSYGLLIVSQWFAAGTSAVTSVIHPREWQAALLLLIVGASVLAQRRGRIRLPRATGPPAQRDLDLFVAGAGVYVCSYALARNFDYRLVFLLLTIPQLLRWTHDRRPLALLALAALLGTLWLDSNMTSQVPLLGSALHSWDELSNFEPFDRPLPIVIIAQLLLFAGLTACLSGLLPIRRRSAV